MKIIFKIDKKAVLRLTCWIGVLAYLGMIFSFSAQDGIKSNALSKAVVKKIEASVELAEKVHSDNKTHRINYNEVIRKSAHFLLYFVLAVIFFMALIISKLDIKSSIIFTLIFCVLFAVSDEIHQTFVPERTPLFKDVVIDSVGALTGVIFIFCLWIIKRSRNQTG